MNNKLILFRKNENKTNVNEWQKQFNLSINNIFNIELDFHFFN